MIRSPLLALANFVTVMDPMIWARGRRLSWPFGRCAETYPFRQLLMSCGNAQAAQQVYGAVLCNDIILSAPEYTGQLYGPI